MKSGISLVLVFLLIASHAFGLQSDALHPCITIDQYAKMEMQIDANKKMLGLDKNNATARMNASVKLEWPMKPVANFPDYNYFYISAHVDQNKSAGTIKDWNCGTKTYDGHRGNDIVPWPFIWDKMDNNQVEVIAAASGIIVAKVDGNPDRVCNGIGGGGNSNNYISIQHADGSLALYVHLKTGAMTSKGIGQTVVTGEFLGIPGSAGQSGGVHLHFEIRSDGTFANYIDPFFGDCNSEITTSWWANQRMYKEPEVVKVSVNDHWPYAAVCPITKDTVHQVNSFASKPGRQGIFSTYTKEILAGMVWNFKIVNPDGSIFTTWNFTNLSDRNTSSLEWLKTLPTAPGTYTFQVTFNGKNYSTNFDITVPKLPQVIAFGALPTRTFGDGDFDLAHTSSAGLPIHYTSSNLLVAVISEYTVTVVGAGSTNITATQAGDASYEPAQEVVQILTVSKASQAIAFKALAPRNSADLPFALMATASSSLAINYTSSNSAVATITGGKVTLMGIGSALITATQPGNGNYLPALPVVQTLLVNNKTSQTILFTGLVDRTLDEGTFALSAIASSNLTVSFSSASDKITIVGNLVAILKPGRAVITASQAGNLNYNPSAPVDQSFCIKPSKPSITIANGNTELPLLACSAGAGVQWYFNGAPIIGAINTTFQATKAGIYTVQAKVDDCASDFSKEQPLIITGDLTMDAQDIVLIYPNPVVGLLTVSMGNAGKLKEVAIYQIDGILIFSKEETDNEVSINVTDYPSGIYLVTVKTEQSLKTIRFIKK